MRVAARLVALGLLALVAAGCLTTGDVLVDRTWSLVEVHGAPPVAPATASFHHDGTFTVETGCNTAGGSYHLDGNRIVVDTVHQTLMLCEGPLGEQESAVLAVIMNQPTFAIDTGSGRLKLSSTAGQALLFAS